MEDTCVHKVNDPHWRCDAGTTVCNMQFGKHRPNEDFCYKQIRCPGCQTTFQPECFYFQRCSAKVNFCINGLEPDELCVSEDRHCKSRVFGKRGKVALYNMLVIEVDQPGTYQDDRALDEIQTVECSLALRDVSDAGRASASFLTLAMSCMRPRELNPQEIRYVQDSISSKFQCGRRVADTMNQLLSGLLSIHSIPTIRVFQWNGHWYSQDNRRLWAFKKAGLKSVPVRYVDKSSVDERKFTTRDAGQTIRMR